MWCSEHASQMGKTNSGDVCVTFRIFALCFALSGSVSIKIDVIKSRG